MADPKPQTLKRAGERVVEAYLVLASHVFQSRNLLHVGGKGGGCPCDLLALHPAGLLVVPSEGPHKGKRLIIPGVHVVYSKIADEET